MEVDLKMTALADASIDFARKELIEVGWLLFPSSPDAHLEEAAEARGEVLDRLSTLFPEFNWVMPESRQVVPEPDERVAPVDLLERAERERDRYGWDFAIAITDLDLESHARSYAMGTPSRALGVAVLSTARLDERRRTGARSERAARFVRDRVTALALHLFGDLNGVDHVDDPADFMNLPESVDDLDRMESFGDSCIAQFRQALLEVADPRLEEATTPQPSGIRFYLRAAWRNRGAVADAVLRSRPWQFPYRLSKLTTAAVSTMTVLLISAEAWELGMSQSLATVIVASTLTLILTSAFVVHRQRMLLRRHQRQYTEQRAIGMASIVLSVLVGMLTTYVLLFVGTLFLSQALVRPSLVDAWSGSFADDVEFAHYLLMSGFVATLGLAIGALGASFEAPDYFKHIALVDEET